jgi:NADPH:quinone reductase-like Zn-dependent oxidoreductase
LIKMKAIVYEQYGKPEVLKLTELKKPTPKENEVLVKIHASTVTATESTFRQGKPYFSRLFTGLRKPKINILGEELAGEIEAIGKAVQSFHPGDKVFGIAGPTFGANVGVLAPKPANLTYAESASGIDGFLTALPFLRDKGLIEKEHKVLINGASGSVGTSAVQIAKYYGAEVTGVCSSGNVELVKSLGADRVIDYTREDFTKTGLTYNIIFDAVGNTTFPKCKKSLTLNGIYLNASINLKIIPHVLWTSLLGRRKAKIATTGLRPPQEKNKDLLLLKELMEKEIIKPVIDRQYPFDQIIEAHTYVDKGHKKGNVVILVS